MIIGCISKIWGLEILVLTPELEYEFEFQKVWPETFNLCWCIIEHPRYRRKANLDMEKNPKSHQSNRHIKLMAKNSRSLILFILEFCFPLYRTNVFFSSTAKGKRFNKNSKFSHIRHPQRYLVHGFYCFSTYRQVEWFNLHMMHLI